MNRAFRALFLREVRRGWSRIRTLLIVTVVATAAVAVVSRDVALVIGTCSAALGLITPLGPIGDLRRDKTLGDLEFDRVLPVAHRSIALARLCGAAVRLLPAVTLCIPLTVALARTPEQIWEPLIVLPAAAAAWMILAAFTWLFMAVNIRWSLRRVWWLPMTIVFGPRIVIAVLPESTKTAIATHGTALGRTLVHAVQTPAGFAVLLALLLAIPAGFLIGALALFASGLDRYEHDAAISEVLNRPAPRREMAAIGRGPVLAVARYCIRLASEQPTRRIVLLGVFIAMLLFGSAEIKGYAQFYVRTLAVFLPGAVVVQLTTARALGHLEGMQQLPHPAMVTALGHLIALAVLAIPGAAVWALARGVTGTPPTVLNVTTLYGWMVASSWVACVGVMWMTARRMAWIAAGPITLIAAWIVYVGPSNAGTTVSRAASALWRVQRQGYLWPPLVVMCCAIVIGLPLFARGLAEYQPSAASQRRAATWQSLRRRR